MNKQAKYLFSLVAIATLLVMVVMTSLYVVRSIYQDAHSLAYRVVPEYGIDTLEPVVIGGVEQWVHIRGRNKNNPLLLFLHGGPGFPQIGWFDEVQRPWEDYFTVVQWDQRQSGKSYGSLSSLGHTVSNQQMIDDAEEMLAYLRQRFNRDKLFLIGKSYGSYLGMHLVKRRPQWLYAYIGDGQMTNTLGYINAEYQHLVDYAKHQGNKALLEKLVAISPRIDPNNQWQSFIQHEMMIWEELNNLGKGISRTLSTEQFVNNISLKKWMSPHLTLSDIANEKIGDPYVLTAAGYPFSKEFMGINLDDEIGTDFDVPIFLFTGAHDWHVPGDFQGQWFESISAPYKEQIIFSQAAHFPYLESPGEYLVALVTRVLPFSKPDNLSIEEDAVGGKNDG